MSIILGLAINVASFWCLSVTSGTTYSFVGASNKIPTAILGHIFFSSALTRLGWLGIVFGLAAGLGYAYFSSSVHKSSFSPAPSVHSGLPEQPTHDSKHQVDEHTHSV